MRGMTMVSSIIQNKFKKSRFFSSFFKAAGVYLQNIHRFMNRRSHNIASIVNAIIIVVVIIITSVNGGGV